MSWRFLDTKHRVKLLLFHSPAIGTWKVDATYVFNPSILSPAETPLAYESIMQSMNHDGSLALLAVGYRKQRWPVLVATAPVGALHRVHYSFQRPAGVSDPCGAPRLTFSFTAKTRHPLQIVKSRPPTATNRGATQTRSGKEALDMPSYDAFALDSHRASRLLHQSGLGGIHAPSVSHWLLSRHCLETVQTIFGVLLRDWRSRTPPR
ncbi:hypothetical protein QR685DRAFT_132058 [Neurospora intermedia]|uniref:Uncharacterized protein n=1 Tax=Neurospora intermedia TaxID=5142 RepID=A0ABR3CYN9_NEUIN